MHLILLPRNSALTTLFLFTTIVAAFPKSRPESDISVRLPQLHHLLHLPTLLTPTP